MLVQCSPFNCFLECKVNTRETKITGKIEVGCESKEKNCRIGKEASELEKHRAS